MSPHPREPRAVVVPAPYVVHPSQHWDGNDGLWSTFRVSIGVPGQNFRILPSTAGSETWVPLQGACTSSDPTDCPEQRGIELYNGKTSTGLAVPTGSWEEVGLYTLDLETHLGYNVNGQYGTVNVTLGGSQDQGTLGLAEQIVAGYLDTQYFLGLFGLGTRPVSFSSSAPTHNSFLWNAYNQSKIPSLSYGYTAGAPYRLKRVLGNLVLGGYDSSRFKPSSLSFSFADEQARALTVGVQSIVASNTLLGVVSFTSEGHISVIDSTVPHIWLPTEACDLVANAFGLIYDNSTELYTINDTTHAKMLELNPTVTFKLGNSAHDDGNSTNIVLPYAAFDLQAKWPIYEQPTNYFPIRRAANESQYTLGRTFLQEAYIVVDHGRRNFSVNQATFEDPAPASHIVAISATDPDSGHEAGISGGAIGGIVAGVVVFLIVAGLSIWFFCVRKRRRRQKAGELDDTSKPPGVAPVLGSEKTETVAGEYKDEAPANVTELNDTSIQELAGFVPSQDHKGHYAPGSQELESNPISTGAATQELDSQPIFYELPAEPHHFSHAEVEGSRGPSPLVSPRSGHSTLATTGPSPALSSAAPAAHDGLVPAPLAPHRGASPPRASAATGTGYLPPTSQAQEDHPPSRHSWEHDAREDQMLVRGENRGNR